jgi:hypothetical protein
MTGLAAMGLVLLLAPPAWGQIHAGDASMNLNGTVSGGYAASSGNTTGSSHSLNFGGTGTLSGSYYNPNFLSFNFSPYYNQSQANSNFQSITNSSGFNFSSAIFSGSHFPGSISYSKAFNSEGNYGVPGLPNYTTHGNSGTFGLNWSENLPNVPSLSFGYQQGGSQYSIYGANDNGNSDFHSFNLQSGYRIAGTSLNGYYHRGNSHTLIPQLFSDSTEPLKVNSHSDGFGFGASHALPLSGTISANFNRTNFGSEDQGYNYHGTVDLINLTASIQPAEKVRVSLSSNYSDNLSGSLYQALAPSEVVVVPVFQNDKSHSLDTIMTASYSISPFLQAQGNVERRDQYFLGQNYGETQLGGGLTYTHSLLGGQMSGATFLTDNRVDNTKLNVLGLNTTFNFNRAFGRWVANSSFGYSQNVQTLLVTYTTSYYHYSGHIRRRFGDFSWSAGGGASHTGFTALPGSTSKSESLTTGIGWKRWITANGGYSTSSGIAVPASSGLLAPPNTTPLPVPSLLILYGGHSYSGGLGSSPIRGLILSASYSKARSNTSTGDAGSWNLTRQMNFYIQYRFRKMFLTSGYANLLQGFSASAAGPAKVSSYYIGVSRWFSFF